MIKVVKFGGSSLASATQFARSETSSGQMKTADMWYRVRREKETRRIQKVTDMLYQCYALAEAEEDFRIPLKKIKGRYDSIINGLSLKTSLDEQFKTIEENFKNKAGKNYAASRGEYFKRYRHGRLPGL